jgi:hypothetical protein
VAEEGTKVDWKAVLDWWQHTSPMPEKAMESALAHAMYIYMVNHQSGQTRWVMNQLAIGLLEHNPQLANSIAPTTVDPAHFLSLSCRNPATDWLGRSDLDLENLIIRGLQQQSLRVLWTDDMTPEQARQAMETWRASHPAVDDAWRRLAAKDERLAAQTSAWLAVWLPQGQYKGSPLQAWCERKTPAQPSPLDAPMFMESHTNAAHAKQMYRSLERFSPTLRHGLQVIHEDMGAEVEARLPPHWLALGLQMGFSWAQKALVDPAFIEESQQVLRDERVWDHGKWALGGATVAELLTQSPAWRTWRGPQDRSFLDLWLDGRPKTMDHNRVWLMTKAKTLRLAKLAPELMMAPVKGQGTVMDHLVSQEDGRAELRRVVLKTYASRKPQAKRGSGPL